MGTRCGCGAGCETFGHCIRRKNIKVSYCRSAAGLDYTASKNNRKELDLYASARRQGVQPAGTHTAHTRAALDESDRTGSAFDAGKEPEWPPQL